MRRAEIYYGDILAGVLEEIASGEYAFTYHPDYVANYPRKFITFTMPVRTEPYISKTFFPFFDGLIPEGWLLQIARKTWKIDKYDQMGLLMVCCRNCIGAVSVLPILENHGEQ